MKFFLYRLNPVLIFIFMLCVAAGRGEGSMIESGKKVKFDYNLKVDGQMIESSDKTGPIEYTHGQNNIIPGLERQMQGLNVGDKRTITVSPEEGYGQANPEAFKEVPKSELPQELDPKVGQILSVTDNQGNNFPVIVSEVQDETIVLNLNHPLAGKVLQFNVTIVDVK